jgi:type II secretory pathway component GspD/PulD (secretin)
MFRILTLCSVIALFPAYADSKKPPKKRNVVITRETVAERQRNIVIKREAQPVSAVIPLESTTYKELEQFIRPMLTLKGRMGYVTARKAVIVYDQKKNVDQIRNFITEADAPGQNIRIEVEFLSGRTNSDRNVTADFHRRRPGGALVDVNGNKVRGPRGVDITARDQGLDVEHNAAQQIMTLSGHPARIFVGRRIPDPSYLAQFEFYNLVSIAHGIEAEQAPVDMKWTDVGSAMYVLPVLRADGVIEVELIPAVTFVDGEGLERAVRVQEVSTKVIAYSRNFMRELFGPDVFGKTAKTDALQIWMTPTVIERKKRPKYTEHPERKLPPSRFFK